MVPKLDLASAFNIVEEIQKPKANQSCCRNQARSKAVGGTNQCWQLAEPVAEQDYKNDNRQNRE